MVAPAPFTSRSPEVREFRRLHRARRELNDRLLAAIPFEAFEEIGDRLEVREGGRFVLSSEGAAALLAGCCVHDWLVDGRSLVERLAERAERLSPDERVLLDAFRQARCTVLRVEEWWPGAGARAYDVLDDKDVALLDEALARGPDPRGLWVLTRLVPMEKYWMTTGATIVLGSWDRPDGDMLVDFLRDVRQARSSEHEMALFLAGMALLPPSAAEDLDPAPGDGRDAAAPLPLRPGRNQPCPCGSGRKYKRCCGA